MHQNIVFTLFSTIISPSRMAADLPYMSHLAGHMYQVGCMNHRTARTLLHPSVRLSHCVVLSTTRFAEPVERRGQGGIFPPDMGRFRSKTCSFKCHVLLLAPLRFCRPSAASERPLYLTTVWVCFCSGWPRSGNEKWKDSQNSFRIIHFMASWSWRRTTFFFL